MEQDPRIWLEFKAYQICDVVDLYQVLIPASTASRRTRSIYYLAPRQREYEDIASFFIHWASNQ